MLPGRRRIRRADEFRSVLRGPARAATPTVVVHLGRLPSQEDGSGGAPCASRAGLVVGRSVGGAVDRNRVKRRLRHCLAPLLGQVPDGWGIVVRALPAAGAASSAALSADLTGALGRCLTKVGQRPVSGVAVSP